MWLPIAALVVVTLGQTGFGRLLYAIGDNREGCRLAGVRVWRLILIDYIICALLASIAGFVLVGHTNSADLSLAATYLLPSIAAVIIGGTSIFGGRGGYSGSIVGALILTVLDGLLTLLDSPEPIKQILYGAIIFALAAAYSRLTTCAEAARAVVSASSEKPADQDLCSAPVAAKSSNALSVTRMM